MHYSSLFLVPGPPRSIKVVVDSQDAVVVSWLTPDQQMASLFSTTSMSGTRKLYPAAFTGFPLCNNTTMASMKAIIIHQLLFYQGGGVWT